jgi:hypothetical protein
MRVPRGWGSNSSSQPAHDGGKVVSPTHRPPLSPGITSVLISVRGWVNPRTIVRPEGLCQWKTPVTPSGIEPATFQLVDQCLNQLRHRVPIFQKYCGHPTILGMFHSGGLIKIKRQRTKCSSPGKVATGIYAPLTDKNHFKTTVTTDDVRDENGTRNRSVWLYRTQRLSETSRQTGISLLSYTIPTDIYEVTINSYYYEFEQGEITSHKT